VWKHFEKQMRGQGIDKKRLIAECIGAFRQEFKYDGPLDSDRHRETLRQAQLARMQGKNGEQLRANLAKKSSGPRPERYGKTGLNPSGWNPSNWEISKCLTLGMDQADTAKKLGGKDNHKLIGRRAASMDLARDASFLCDCGDFFLNRSLFGLRELSGFAVSDFDKIVGLSEGRSQASRPGDSIANPEDARLAIEWRNGVIRELLNVSAESHCGLRLGEKVYSQERVLKIFLPELAGLNGALVLTIGKIRQEAHEHPEWAVDQLGELCICRHAAIEQSANSQDTRWRKSLRYLATQEKFLKGNLTRLRGTEGDGELVREMIGYGAHHYTVQNALRDNTDLIPPLEIRMLIKEFAPKFAKPKPKQGGAPTGLRDDTIERIRRMAGLEMAHPRWTQERMAPFVFWDTPASCQSNIRPFSSTYRPQIDALKQKLTKSEIQEIVRDATKFLKDDRS
jgi:hypothetical protein